MGSPPARLRERASRRKETGPEDQGEEGGAETWAGFESGKGNADKVEGGKVGRVELSGWW